jgi:hypothetical protein
MIAELNRTTTRTTITRVENPFAVLLTFQVVFVVSSWLIRLGTAHDRQ